MKSFFASNPFQPSPFWKVFSYLVLFFWTIVVLFPLYWLLITAFKAPIDVQSGPKYLPFIDFQPSLYGWNEVFTLLNPVRQYLNTINIGIFSSVLAIIIGASASYALNRFVYHPKPGLILTFILCVAGMILLIALKIPWYIAVVAGLAVFLLLAQTIGKRMKGSMGNSDIAFWLVSQRMLPPVAVIIPIYVMFQSVSLLNTHAALIIAYTAANLPLAIWFLRDYFSGIPIELEESAFIDGATRYQVLWRIILPLSMPGLVATFLIVLVFAWNEYTLALFLTGAETQTMPLLVAGQNATRGPQWWNISVLVILMIAPLIGMAIALERYISRGILVGAVKG
ncbi:MAG: carbohydrate ABC transporter permease [Anaerolineae bacterium]|nr:carbohydrate ABC transporter permease [Anaerolineae bacterium]